MKTKSSSQKEINLWKSEAEQGYEIQGDLKKEMTKPNSVEKEYTLKELKYYFDKKVFPFNNKAIFVLKSSSQKEIEELKKDQQDYFDMSDRFSAILMDVTDRRMSKPTYTLKAMREIIEEVNSEKEEKVISLATQTERERINILIDRKMIEAKEGLKKCFTKEAKFIYDSLINEFKELKQQIQEVKRK